VAEASCSGSQPLIAYQVGDSCLSIRPAPAPREWMSSTDQRFANRCLPLLIANQGGWVLLNNIAFSAMWSGGNAVDAVSVSYDQGHSPPLAGSYFGYGIVTWSIPFIFRTPPGFNLLVRGPANSPKDAVSPLEGIVESDWMSSTFTMNWKITRPFIPVRFEVDEPICMIVPQRRGELEGFRPEVRSLETNTELRDQHHAWASSRREFLRELSSHSVSERAAAWQRDYFQGRHADGRPADQAHQTRLHLRGFEPKS
jgi:hypothetical protein